MGALIASAVVGLDTHQTVAYQMFAFLLSLFIIALLCTIRFRARFEAMRILPQFGTVGERLIYTISIKNLSTVAQSGLSMFENIEDPRPSFQEFLEAQEPNDKNRNLFDRIMGYHRWLWLISIKQGALIKKHFLPPLPPNSETNVKVEIMPSRRGPLSLTGLTIARPGPFGLFKSCITVPVKQSILVLPKRYSMRSLHFPGARKYQPGGVALASSVGNSDEFISLRDYHAGDSPRKIHWKSWAKMGKPIVKEYQDEFFIRHALILDTFQETEYTEIFETAISVAATFVSSIHEEESLLDFMFVGPQAYCFTSGRSLAYTSKILEILASIRACKDQSFSALSSLVMNHAAQLSGGICILLAWDKEREECINYLMERSIPLVIVLITETKDLNTIDPGPLEKRYKDFYIIEAGKAKEGLSNLWRHHRFS
ncbi:MAG: DUF58 domain-containing protein [bacterium]